MNPTKQDIIDLIGVYRVVVRARTGWRFTSLKWAASHDLGGGS